MTNAWTSQAHQNYIYGRFHVRAIYTRANSWRMRFEFIVYSAIQGYHEYKDIWENPIIGEELKCQREIGNRYDPLAVAMLKQIDGHDTIVGHVSRKRAASCNAFSRRGGIIECTVTSNRRYNVEHSLSLSGPS